MTTSEYRGAKTLIAASFGIALFGLSACDKKSDEASQAPAASSVSSPAAAPISSAAPQSTPEYTPPSADQLYQMVAPIALFPDKLVALVLASATYPVQIREANTWVTQNPSLNGPTLVAAADQQNWDPSIKALTAFPAVLSQMASNIGWTTALGQAYYNDPTDVLNAIQVMRLRAKNAGNLKTSSRIRITEAAQSVPADYSVAPNAQPIYEGPEVIEPPVQTIIIEPAQPDVVYVPEYNQADVYGTPVSYYPGYDYRPPPPPGGPGVAVVTGAVAFGVGVTVGALYAHHDWGWHAWGMNWGGPDARHGRDRTRGGPGEAPSTPAVVYNHTSYVSQSTTVINHVNNTHITENYSNTQNNYNSVQSTKSNPSLPPNGATGTPGVTGGRPSEPERHAPPAGAPAAAPMTSPHFSANDMRPGAPPAQHQAPPQVPSQSPSREIVPAPHAQQAHPPEPARQQQQSAPQHLEHEGPQPHIAAPHVVPSEPVHAQEQRPPAKEAPPSHPQPNRASEERPNVHASQHAEPPAAAHGEAHREPPPHPTAPPPHAEPPKGDAHKDKPHE